MYRNNVRILLKEIAPDTFPVPNHTGREWARWRRSFWFLILTRCLRSLSPVDWRSTHPSRIRMTASERLNSRIMMGMCYVLGNRSNCLNHGLRRFTRIKRRTECLFVTSVLSYEPFSISFFRFNTLSYHFHCPVIVPENSIFQFFISANTGFDTRSQLPEKMSSSFTA